MSLAALRRFVDPPTRVRAVAEERCDMCARPIGHEHPHVVNVESRALLCACRPCFLLFTVEGAGQGKFRAVPDRYVCLTELALDDRAWDQLQLPVRMAFFFKNSSLGKFVAFYPSPAGATESLLALDAWQELVDATPLLATIAPDVEALLVRGGRGGAFESFIVPINACYELVGRVRKTWRGFDGGEEAWTDIDAFFAGLREKSAVS